MTETPITNAEIASAGLDVATEVLADSKIDHPRRGEILSKFDRLKEKSKVLESLNKQKDEKNPSIIKKQKNLNASKIMSFFSRGDYKKATDQIIATREDSFLLEANKQGVPYQKRSLLKAISSAENEVSDLKIAIRNAFEEMGELQILEGKDEELKFILNEYSHI